MSIPADRGHLSTEFRNDASLDLDALPTRACVELMVEDHAQVRNAVAAASGAIAAFVDGLVEKMAAGGRLIYLGAGTSGRLGVLDASECPPTFQSDPEQVVGIIAGGDASLRNSSEAKEDDPNGAAAALDELSLTNRDTVLGIAAGGTTPYVLGGIALAQKRGAATGLLTCVKPTFNVGEAKGFADVERGLRPHHLIVLDTGPEVLAGSTRLKAGSATKLALNIISTTTFIKLGKVYSNLMVDLRATNDKLADRAIRILIELCPALSRTDAAAALTAAGGRLKTAIVMQRLTVGRQRAEELISTSGGSLRPILHAG